MAGYIQWIAQNYSTIASELDSKFCQLRSLAQESASHARVPSNVANLALGVHYFLQFAESIDAVSHEQRDAYWDTTWQSLGCVSAAQTEHQEAANPELRFIELVISALGCGQAHLTNSDGRSPSLVEAKSCGWIWQPGSGDGYLTPQGKKIGWIVGPNIYLDPVSSFQLVQEMCRYGEGIGITQTTLHKRLHEAGLLASIDETRKRLTIRRALERTRRNVLHIRTETLTRDSSPATATSKNNGRPASAEQVVAQETALE
jgi:hypothetical protein